ncbi:SEC-C metal-binding domain-containing protein [Paenibacillus thailandensis]|uniref:SEC-C metal-binding domain-containing protein n=1 Tax=Paenibacillus thailandensis TaxID=393250 RepID=A0ABW5QW03_9BACL
MDKIGRNDLCYCGSGLKYKRCCLGKDQSNNRLQSALLTSGKPNVALTENDIIHMIDVELSWSTESYRALAVHLLEHMKGRYEDSIILEAIALWNRFSEHTKPSFRKPGIFAAAIEFAVAEANEAARSQAELADIYGVSTGSLSKRILEVNAYIETTLSGKSSDANANANVKGDIAPAVSGNAGGQASFDAQRELERLNRAMKALALNYK